MTKLKNGVIWAICLLMALTGLIPAAFAEEGVELYQWPDETLRTAVESGLKQAMGWMFIINDVNVDDANTLRTQVKWIDLSDCGYTQLPDLSIFESLESLILDRNPLTDIDCLAGDTRIRGLTIAGTQISSLPELPNLVTLDLGNTAFDTLPELPNLQNLSISGTAIRELPLMPNLTSLYAYGAVIDDYSVLDGCAITNLRLGGEGRMLTEAEKALIAKHADSLNELHVDVSRFEDFDFLQGCKALTTLMLTSETPSVFSEDAQKVVASCGLKILQLKNCGLTSIDFLSGQEAMEQLFLEDNQIRDISVISGMTKLKYLMLNNNQIEDITPLQAMEPWTFKLLDITNNRVSDLSPLAGIEGLFRLLADDNNIADASPLSKLYNLNEIHLARNQLTSVKAFSRMEVLFRLYLADNQIKDLSPLAKCTLLSTLDLTGNQITDPTPLNKLSNLQALELYDNPVNEKKAAAYKGRGLRTGTREDYERLDEPLQTECDAVLKALEREAGETTYRAARDCYSLDLSNAGLNEFPDLSAFESLHGLQLSGNDFPAFPETLVGLTNIEIGSPERELTQAEMDFLAQNENLELLHIQFSKAPDFSFLAQKKQLIYFLLTGSGETPIDLSTLSGLKNLEMFQITDCKLEDISALAKLKKLDEVEFVHCSITDEAMQQLGKMTALTRLIIRDCGLQSIDFLAKLKKLTILGLAENQLSDISPLAKLSKLEVVRLTENQISDFSPLYKLKKLTQLSVGGNPVENWDELLEALPVATLD